MNLLFNSKEYNDLYGKMSQRSDFRFCKWSLPYAWKVSVLGVLLVRFFSHSDWMWKINSLNPNVWEYGPEKTTNTDTFHAVTKIKGVAETPTNIQDAELCKNS